MKEIDPNEIARGQLHKTILATIGPRPIAFASTIDSDGNPNLAPFSFFNAFGVNPTTLIFSPSRRGRDNTVKHTYENVKALPEVVINVVNFDMVQQTSLASTEYDKGINEFIKAGFTPLPSKRIKPFRVKESPVQYECKVREVVETGDQGGAANLVICEIVYIHIREDLLDENDLPDQTKIDLVGRMGGNYYVRAHGDALFKVEKPVAKKGLGIDLLPERIRSSHILTGNDLGKLGNIEQLPTLEEIELIKQEREVITIFETCSDNRQMLQQKLQEYAKNLLEKGEAHKALKILML